jgi:transcriptional regulator with XRE-family HTH domain
MSSSKTLHDLPGLTRHYAQMADFGKDFGDQIRAAREAKGWRQADLASKMKVTRNAVSLWENNTNKPALPKILQMIRLFGVESLGGIKADTARSLVPIVNDDLMPVNGYAAASTWQELDEVGQEPKDWIPFSQDPAFGSRRQYAIEVRGNSMDLLVKDGQYAIVVDAFGQAPRDGDVVVVRRIRGNLIERTIKRFRENTGPGVLMPESTESRHEPVPFIGDEETTIEIEAFVIGFYSRLNNR